MKKQKMKKILCFWLSCIMLAVCLPLSAIATEVAPLILPPDMYSPLFMYGSTHSYDEGIIDGGVYALCNVYNNENMDVYSEGTADGTRVLTWPFHGNVNHWFRFIYIGMGVYEIAPSYVDSRLHVEDNNNIVIRGDSKTVAQRFKIQVLQSGAIILLTEASGYTKALCPDAATENVMQKDYNSLSNPTEAQWMLQRRDETTEDWYENYYIRNATDRSFLDVIGKGVGEGDNVHSCTFYGGSNQEWKVVYDTEANNYTLRPGHRRDMALDYRGERTSIYTAGADSTQRFQITAEVDDGDGVKYLIKTLGTETPEYLTKAERMDTVSNNCYISTTTTTDADNDGEIDDAVLWYFESVDIDLKDAERLDLNQWRGDSVMASYNEVRWVTYQSPVNSRYKIELNGSNVNFGTLKNLNGTNHDELDYKVYNGLKIFDVFLQAGEAIFIPVEFSGTVTAGASAGFSVWIRQLTFAGHSYNLLTDGTKMSEEIDQLECLLELELNFSFDHKRQKTAQEAKTQTHKLYENSELNNDLASDFNSEIFMYSGHGAAGIAAYEGTAGQELRAAFFNQDMSNCELAIWDCCLSAVYYSENGQYHSLASKSLENGANAVMAWDMSPCTGYTRPFIKFLFEEIQKGKSIRDASYDALLTLAEQEENHIDGCEVCYLSNDTIEKVVSNALVSGNIDHIIYPIYESNDIPIVTESSIITKIAQNDFEYTLVAENNTLGIKMYTKMINGIKTEDFFLEFYNDKGELTKVYKSDKIIDEQEIVLAEKTIEHVKQRKNENIVEQNTAEEYRFCYVNDELRLAKLQFVPDDMCPYCMHVTYCDALTGEVIF